MFCEKCGASVGENDQFCPECGEKIAGNAVTEPEKETTEKQETVQTPVQQETVQQETVQTPVQPLPQEPVQEKKAKKGGKKLPLIIAACVVIVALVIGFANSSALANTFKKATASPEEYYQWVEKKQLEEVVESVGTVYEDYLLQILQCYDQSNNVELTLTCEEGVEDWLDMLELLTGGDLDLSWLSQGKLGINQTMKDGVLSGTVNLTLDKQELLELTGIVDSEKENIYVGIPTLSGKYLGVDMDDSYDGRYLAEMLQTVASLEKLEKVLPKSEKLEKILNKYIELALSKLDDVKLNDKKTLRAGGVTQECTQLKVTIDMDMLSEMVEEIFEALAEDEDIEKMIIDVCQALDDMDGYDLDVDADDIYDEFVEECEYLAKHAKYIDGDEEVVMLVYVDNIGNVVGREIKVEDDVTITLFAPEDGKKVGCKASVEAYGTTYFALEGSGTTSGNSLDATFSLEIGEYELVEITTKKLDLDSLKTGLTNGTVEVRLAGGVSKLLDLYFENQYSWYEWWYGESYDYKNDSDYKMATKVLSLVEDMVLSMDASMSKDKRTTTISLAEESGKKTEQLVSLKVVAETGSGKKVSLPSDKNVYDATDIDDLEDWWDEFDWKDFLKKLDKTSLPSDWIDTLDDISDMDFDDLFDFFW